MYTKFRTDVLARLQGLEAEQLHLVAQALDLAAAGYNITETGAELSRSGIEDIFRRIAEETGIRVTPHILRHTFATQALTGTGVEVVQRMLGHSNVSTTMIYAEVDPRSVRTAHDRTII